MRTTAVKSLVLCSGLLMSIVSPAVACFAQSQGQEQQPIGTTQASASEPESEASQSGESKLALSAGSSQGEAGDFTESRLGLSLLRNIALDQKAIWTSPKNLRWGDVNWLVPVGAVTAASFMADTSISRAATGSPSRVSSSTTFSNYGLAALGGAVGGSYLLGQITNNDHERETGLLSGESAVDAVMMTTALQYAFGRQRPTDGNGGGGFWHSGTSFPSEHATAAWAVASVIAHEYPGPLTKFLAYGLASAVSASRVTGKDHFPTDVLVGSAIGWFVGQHVYVAHHDPEVGGGEWGPLVERTPKPTDIPAESAASTFVPLDSWVYPAFERLAAMGYVTSALQGLKPWTRIECARLTEEVGDALLDTTEENHDPDKQAVQLQEALKLEFNQEIAVLEGGRNQSFAVDSVYTRVMSISGPILTDGFDLGGQTISYDFGRPFRRGTNEIVGTSVHASEGPFAFYARVEYQHSPSAPSLPDSALQFISTSDQHAFSGNGPVMPVTPQPFAPVNRADLLEGYITFNHDDWQLSAGKQAMSWGVGEGGSMLFSDNAEPLDMIRLTRVVPTELPGILRKVGRFRTEWFIAKVNGGISVPHPLMYGQKFSFMVAHFLEIGYGRTNMLGRGPGAPDTAEGAGYPFTTISFLRSFFGINQSYAFGVPGFNNSAMDLNLDVPGLRHSVSLYAELYERVVPVFIADPPLGSYRAGIYIPRLPHASRMDFRFESTSTESPIFTDPLGGRLNYIDHAYLSGYTNFGQLMGNTVGRQGRIFQAWTTFHFSGPNQIQFSFLDHQVDGHFVPGGGLWQDYTASHEIHFRSDLYVKSMVQIEHIQHFPILFNGRENNVTISVEFGVDLKGAKF